MGVYLDHVLGVRNVIGDRLGCMCKERNIRGGRSGNDCICNKIFSTVKALLPLEWCIHRLCVVESSSVVNWSAQAFLLMYIAMAVLYSSLLVNVHTVRIKWNHLLNGNHCLTTANDTLLKQLWW